MKTCYKLTNADTGNVVYIAVDECVAFECFVDKRPPNELAGTPLPFTEITTKAGFFRVKETISKIREENTRTAF